MDCPMVAGHAEQAGVGVEVDAVDGGGVGAASQLDHQVAAAHVKDPYEGPLHAGCGQPRTFTHNNQNYCKYSITSNKKYGVELFL